jgi:squalene-hopene/tetraprenyl-beta-curcumene cyclase
MKSAKRILAAVVALSVMATSAFAADRPQTETEKKAVAYLVSMQGKGPDGKAIDTAKFANADGAWMPEVGPAVTAMVVKGLIHSGSKVDDLVVAKGLKYIDSTRKGDGGYYTQAVPAYNTAIVMSTLAVLPQTQDVKDKIAAAQKFLRSTQLLEGAKDSKGAAITKDHPWYGGSTYGGGAPQKPDLSNTSYFIDAMLDTGVSKDDPAIQAAMVYVSRAQANGATNDQAWAKELQSGGFIYSLPERAGGEVLKEYGSMTYAGLKSFVYAGMTKDDPRVKAALKWIGNNWSLDMNPGLGDDSGVFYYYNVFGKALRIYGEEKIKDSKGVEHDWRAELLAALAKRQKDGGFFTNDKKDKWMEQHPFLATAFAVLAMQEARQ